MGKKAISSVSVKQMTSQDMESKQELLEGALSEAIR
jgi:hypothetical protein